VNEAALTKVRGLVFDVDGVLTDASVYIGEDGSELKRFSIQDGTGIYWSRMLGFEIALVSGRHSAATTRRAVELGIEAVYQGVRDKPGRIATWAGERGLAMDEILYVGDDLIDLPVFEAVGVAVAPANAVRIVREKADHVTAASGGDGAVREVVEWLLESTGRIEEAWEAYRGSLARGEAGEVRP